jgi:hypothetical protein
MAYYALLDEDNFVTQVIVGEENSGTYWEDFYSDLFGQRCLLTDINTQGGQHSLGATAFRGNYAGIGYTYDEERDAFIPPKPYDSWVLNEDTCLWNAPVAYPTDEGMYDWDEETTQWVAVAE